MRIEHVDPGEEVRGLASDPVEGARDDEIRGTLGHRDLDRAPLLGHLIVVDVEPRREAEALGEREAADEGAGREPARLEPGRQRRRAGPHPEPAVVAHPVLVGKQSAENGRVGRQRHHGVRVGERKARAAGGEAVHVRRLRRSAVRRQRVGPQRVNRDEKDVLIRRRFEHEPARAGTPEEDGRDQ
jgi:hypothetical protein